MARSAFEKFCNLRAFIVKKAMFCTRQYWALMKGLINKLRPKHFKEVFGLIVACIDNGRETRHALFWVSAEYDRVVCRDFFL